MKPSSKLAKRLASKEFIVTAEFLPPASADRATVQAVAGTIGNALAAVSVADNHDGVGMSSIAASSILLELGLEPIYQLVTRDRNRIALQSDLLGASALGIRNVLCTSGNHQSLIKGAESANVYDLDAIQLVWAARRMRDKGVLLDESTFAGEFPMLIGAVVNPYLKPLELNMIQLAKKIEAGADFVQTHPIFDVGQFIVWLDTARKEGLADRTAIIAGVMPLTSAEETERLRAMHTDLQIPDKLVERLKATGSADAQAEQGLAVAVETIAKLRATKGVRGIHIVSGGRETLVQKVRVAAGL